ncbi:MAG TPA: nucleotidyltransferase domain-containing protein [Nocardioides sp.]|nr:nucleotidyltransferase domain-containing protein [Nocardioides sp.]
MSRATEAVEALAERLRALDWSRDLWVAGSLATGDHVPGVSDLDLVAVVDGEITSERRHEVEGLHRALDAGPAAGTDLGCQYVEAARVLDRDAVHPTWTHGSMVDRIVSGITRAELVRHGYAVLGRAPTEVLPPMTDDDVRAAARAELLGYWAWAARRPQMWWSPVIADLGLTAMARGRHALATGQLLTKSEAIEQAAAPRWLVGQLLARRRGEAVTSPRARTAWIAWRDARRTVGAARRRWSDEALEDVE